MRKPNQMNTDIVKYYKQRAAEYDNVYLKPERQDELEKASKTLQGIFAGKHVFEIACGTGYWTQRIAQTANSILATDINEEVLTIARQKTYPKNNVKFEKADFFNHSVSEKQESLFGGFIWSHILLQQIGDFINVVNNFVQPGGTVVLMDNNYVEDGSLPIDKRDEQGNTYQFRQLNDGSRHLVLKNFPDKDFMNAVLKGKASDIQIIIFQYYWLLHYKTPTSGN